ncbi:dTMP kinase [Acidianus sp. HS-5]|uniref:dTMP kinase n=1 Tax=Acidianus sp. HS-5 TaxID=2886040 RepID=UPI001F0085D4|nr:dTMP kinase [Acidianus sp. HS-5]BDC19007.1 thymidylate kinase [Acidianus sp. HS-5]
MLIAIEGIDGSGKTTLAKDLVKWLEEEKKKKTLLTAEPFTEEITKLIQQEGWKDPVTLALLFSADRGVHINWITKQDYDIIITDRYYYSTIAYQSAMGIDKNWIIEVNKYFPKPELTILLDLPAEIALTRIKKDDKFNFKEKLSLLQKVRENYLNIAKLDKTIRIIDSTKSFKEVLKEAKNYVEELVS